MTSAVPYEIFEERAAQQRRQLHNSVSELRLTLAERLDVVFLRLPVTLALSSETPTPPQTRWKVTGWTCPVFCSVRSIVRSSRA